MKKRAKWACVVVQVQLLHKIASRVFGHAARPCVNHGLPDVKIGDLLCEVKSKRRRISGDLKYVHTTKHGCVEKKIEEKTHILPVVARGGLEDVERGVSDIVCVHLGANSEQIPSLLSSLTVSCGTSPVLK
jgi:hypothetical protein